MEVRRPELVADPNPPLRIALSLNSLTDATVDRLKEVLHDHPGGSEVFLTVGSKVIRLPPAFNVDCRNGLMGELRTLLGPRVVLAETASPRS